MKRILIGAIFAMFAAFLFVFIVFFIGGSSVASRGDIAFFGSIVAVFVAFCSLLFWGVPIHLVLLKTNITSPYAYLFFGFLPSPIFIFLFKPFGADTFDTLLLQSFICGVTGAIVALTFWSFAVNNKMYNE